MSEPPGTSEEMGEWLLTLRLPQYASCFQEGGYKSLEDCRDLTEECLMQLQILPTGHRRRILRSLEALGIRKQQQQSGGEQDAEGALENGPRRRKPPLYPRHIFMQDKRRGTSCQVRQQRDWTDLPERHTLPAGVALGTHVEAEADGRCVRPPQPTLRHPANIQTSQAGLIAPSRSSDSSSSSSSSSGGSIESLSVSEMPSDWDLSSEDPSLSSTDSLPYPAEATSSEGGGGFSGEMVENVIYEAHTSFKIPAGVRPTRSYRLRHRPVPEIPDQNLPAPLHDRSAALLQTNSPEHLAGSQGPAGADGVQKAPHQQSALAPYGEMLLHNSPESTRGLAPKEVLQKAFRDKLKHRKLRKKAVEPKEPKEQVPPPDLSVRDLDRYEYSTVDDCASILSRVGSDQRPMVAPESLPAAPQEASVNMVESEVYLEPADSVLNAMPDISPYACFYGAPKHQMLKVGWLDKLSPQGNCVFQRRWVRLDSEILAYYNNDKEMYSKGMILASAIRQVRGLGDNKFEVVTSLRTFVFRAEREGERQEWMEALQTATRPPTGSSQKRADSLPHHCSANRRGLLELRGYKGRVLVSLAGSKVRLCKTEQDYKAGLAIAEVELTAANIRDVDRRSFDVNTPFKNFCFTAESEREKEEWIEAVQESIVETLSDYEVAEKIWFNETNGSCADCRTPQPEWASINLGVVICKKCAGQHRSLGPSISKVRSLKLDSSIWSNALVELFLAIGNKNANGFWAANLPLEEEIHSGAPDEQRATFIRRKYREGKYRRLLEDLHSPEELNKALCAAVVTPDVLQTMALVFSGADVMCATGDPAMSTPYLLAQRAAQRLQMEFLHQNKLTDFPRLDQWSENTVSSDASPFMDGFLYISSGSAKTMLDRRGKDDMTRRWCTLEGGFLSFYESERSTAAIGRVDVSQVVSLAASSTETVTGAGAVFIVELYLQTERIVLVGAEAQETQRDWIQALTKCFVPLKMEGLLQREAELIGRLHYKEGHDLYHWRVGWFVLEGSTLHFSSGDEAEEEEVLQLKQLQELTVSTQTEGEDKIQVLLMVQGRRTVYIHGFSKTDFTLWHSAITLAAATDSNALGDQQLTKNGVPIIVDSCIAFVTQYGLCQQGVYQRSGAPDRVALLLDEFTRDARNVKLRESEHHLEDVADTLKSFLSQSEDALLTKELYPYWVSALDEKDEMQRVKKYSTFIQSLPKINRSTLEALLQHLHRIQQCSHLNQMPSEKLACIFSPCLFQTRGQTPQEASVVQDLISNYISLFSVTEDRVQQMERENSFILRWNDKKDTTFSPAGDLIFEVYLEKKEPGSCCLIKVSPSMRAAELAETALSMRNVSPDADHTWTTFEVIENGELERPLHHSERVLEQVLEWSGLDCPSAAFLVIKRFPEASAGADGKGQALAARSGCLKFSDGSSKLLSGHKFQDKHVSLSGGRLLLYRDVKASKAEKTLQLSSVKCYLGLKRKLKPPTSWGFTVSTDKQQWHFCCEKREAQVGWVTDIIRMKHGSDLFPKRAKSVQAAQASRGRSLTDGNNVSSQQPGGSRRLTERMTSLDDGGRKPSSYFSPQPRSNVAAKGKSKHMDALKALEFPPRRASLDVCQPQPISAGSPSRPLATVPTLLPPLGAKGINRRPVRGAEGGMPANVLTELNSVLSKSGRGAASNQ